MELNHRGRPDMTELNPLGGEENTQWIVLEGLREHQEAGCGEQSPLIDRVI